MHTLLVFQGGDAPSDLVRQGWKILQVAKNCGAARDGCFCSALSRNLRTGQPHVPSVRCKCMHIVHVIHMMHMTSTPGTHDIIHLIHMNTCAYTK